MRSQFFLQIFHSPKPVKRKLLVKAACDKIQTYLEEIAKANFLFITIKDQIRHLKVHYSVV